MVANVWDVPVFAFDEWYVAQMSPLNRSRVQVAAIAHNIQ